MKFLNKHLSWVLNSQIKPYLFVKLKAEASRIREFKNAYQGKRCFLMGNGPSLNLMNLSLFKDEIVWGSNRCYLMFDQLGWVPKFYTAIDTRVVPDNSVEINTIINQFRENFFYFPNIYNQPDLILEGSNVFWFNQVSMYEKLLPFGVFSTDCSKWVSSTRTVTITMLQLAVYMGFNPIYLIGCDTNYIVPTTVEIDVNGIGLISTQDDDLNHFSPKYFGKGKKWNPPHVDKMIKHYEYAKNMCDYLGVQVYNATVGGKLEVFPRINYFDLVSKGQ